MTDSASQTSSGHHQFRLSRADIAAWEWLPRELTGREKFTHILSIFSMGMLLGLLEDDIEAWMGPLDGTSQRLLLGLAAGAIGFGLSTLSLTLATRWRIARAKLPSTDTVVEHDLQHVTVSEDGRSRFYAWDNFQGAVRTPEHIFLPVGPSDVVIMPLRAFETEADMFTFGQLADQWIRSADADD